MTVFKIKNINNSILIEYSYNYAWIRSGHLEEHINDVTINEVFHKFFTHTNRQIVTYSELCEIIRKNKSKEFLNSGTEGQIANQYIYKVRRILNHIGIKNFIITKRNFGYKINPEWLPILPTVDENIRSEKKSIISSIEKLRNDSISYMEKAELQHSVSGWSFIRGDESILWQNFLELNSIYNLVIDMLAKPGNGHELSEVKNKIIKLSSYSFYWRAGDGISDVKWKSDYKNEINYLTKQIINLILDL